MGTYAGIRSTAASLIAAKGAAVTLSRVSAGTYDPTTNTATGGSTTDYAVVAVAKKGNALRDPERFARLGLQRTASVTLLVAAQGLAITPQDGDRIGWGGVTYTVREVEPVAPDGAGILYECWCAA